jgi:hypothetical protein
VLPFDSVELVVVSFALLFDEFLVLGDLSTERLNGNVLFQKLVGKAVDFLFDVKGVFLAIGHDALSSGFLELFAGSHFTHLFLRGELKLEQLVFEQVILRNKYFKVTTVLATVLFAH